MHWALNVVDHLALDLPWKSWVGTLGGAPKIFEIDSHEQKLSSFILAMLDYSELFNWKNTQNFLQISF